ncbi:hypothetical protein IQ22_01727 [Pseudomonas duriflava]|uniref:Uncharacterized protein n=1 Tax=Pseudomonas duriflava TaxID=459528 RepID=A0A562QDL4_9PSED|nr:hypothetical protein [Pseudomonas duriflava]TWI54824.1 hypothetical protein IQ22_01727 [Pseudomonas duriflava]
MLPFLNKGTTEYLNQLIGVLEGKRKQFEPTLQGDIVERAHRAWLNSNQERIEEQRQHTALTDELQVLTARLTESETGG